MLTSSTCEKAPAIVSLVMLLMTLAPGENPSKGVLKGRLADSAHAPLNHAFILAHVHNSGSAGEVVPLEINGSFSVELSPGFYDLFISSPGFSPTCGQISVEAGKTAVYSAELKVSTLVNSPD
jgi:hypothetical protein